MTKIAEDAAKAFLNRQKFSRKNTVVEIKDTFGTCVMYLHGNAIAEEKNYIIGIRTCGYITQTTQTRLQAIVEIHCNNLKVKRIKEDMFLEWIGKTKLPTKDRYWKIESKGLTDLNTTEECLKIRAEYQENKSVAEITINSYKADKEYMEEIRRQTIHARNKINEIGMSAIRNMKTWQTIRIKTAMATMQVMINLTNTEIAEIEKEIEKWKKAINK